MADDNSIHFSSANYIRRAIHPGEFKTTLRGLARAIKTLTPDVEGIAFRGASGSLVAMPLCVLLKKMPMMIRKQDGNHSGSIMEGGHCSNFVIVDDLVDTGSTVRVILDSIAQIYGGHYYECKGVFCYACDFQNGRPYKYINTDTENLKQGNYTSYPNDRAEGSIPVYGAHFSK